MFSIVKPELDMDSVFDACVSSIQNRQEKEKTSGIKSYIRGCHKVYNLYANYSLIHTLGDEYVSNPACVASQDELVNLYENQMVKNKAGRKKYDVLLGRAPDGICPFCGFAQVTTLDHYLPKRKFPSFSIVPLNLIPSCTDCNKGKNQDVAKTIQDQIIHPYYDHKLFDDQWLFAKVIETRPASLIFFTNPPEYWDAVNVDRVLSHFKAFKLARRFSVQVASEISILRNELDYDFQISRKKGVRQALKNKYSACEKACKNSWRTAMYQALASSDWYCEGGFK